MSQYAPGLQTGQGEIQGSKALSNAGLVTSIGWKTYNQTV